MSIINWWRCGHCDYEGECYGCGFSAPFCRLCGRNNKLTRIPHPEGGKPLASMEVVDYDTPSEEELKTGDYVLATKYEDADPQDHWAVGFYDRVLPYKTGDRHLVVDGDGDQFRANGFRHVVKIGTMEGAFLVGFRDEIEDMGLPVTSFLKIIG